MLRMRRKACLLVAAVLLFPIAASMPLACCAGVAPGAHAASGTPSHCGGTGSGAGSCCDRAADDAAARHCCQGGDAFERPQPGPQHATTAEIPVDLPIPPILQAAPREGLRSARDPVPRFEPLYTLHSSLLI
jgi:hypothetical protein